MKIILLLISLTLCLPAFAQGIQMEKDPGLSYAYISIQGKIFSKKLKVVVDFGDTPEQIKAGQQYSEILTDKKSYAAVLNYMVENDFELVETLTLESHSTAGGNGSGGTSGIIFIMKRKE
ncbi:MAG: hypothetical protein IPI60_09790 [Saprospiraceae bacterium]|nr:hypothetical protein [Saprospiraceae bacterium]